MVESIIQKERSCYFCGRTDHLEKHHIFAGMANRRISDQYGLTVWLCHNHHTGTDGAQYDKEKSLLLKQEAQKAFQAIYGKRLWMTLIRKNYL